MIRVREKENRMVLRFFGGDERNDTMGDTYLPMIPIVLCQGHIHRAQLPRREHFQVVGRNVGESYIFLSAVRNFDYSTLRHERNFPCSKKFACNSGAPAQLPNGPIPGLWRDPYVRTERR